jgi:hypothetical protein
MTYTGEQPSARVAATSSALAANMRSCMLRLFNNVSKMETTTDSQRVSADLLADMDSSVHAENAEGVPPLSNLCKSGENRGHAMCLPHKTESWYICMNSARDLARPQMLNRTGCAEQRDSRPQHRMAQRMAAEDLADMSATTGCHCLQIAPFD